MVSRSSKQAGEPRPACSFFMSAAGCASSSNDALRPSLDGLPQIVGGTTGTIAGAITRLERRRQELTDEIAMLRRLQRRLTH